MSDTVIQAVLGWGVWPAWVAAGVGDWACHRHTDIEHTSGSIEWRLHVVQALQAGIGLVLMLFFRINGLVLILLAALGLAHWLTGYLDTCYAVTRRILLPVEQSIHALLLLLPLFAVVLLGVDAAQSGRLAGWEGSFYYTGMAPASVMILLATVVILGLPLAEEGLRCRSARSSRHGDSARQWREP